MSEYSTETCIVETAYVANELAKGLIGLNEFWIISFKAQLILTY